MLRNKPGLNGAYLEIEARVMPNLRKENVHFGRALYFVDLGNLLDEQFHVNVYALHRRNHVPVVALQDVGEDAEKTRTLCDVQSCRSS